MDFKSSNVRKATGKLDYSPWTRVFVNVWNCFVGLLFFVFKKTKMSDASSQTDPPPCRETSDASAQTVPAANKNASAQTDTTHSYAVAVQTETTHSYTIAVQTDATHYHTTSVQTDARKHNVAAVQTDARGCTTVAASQTESTDAFRLTNNTSSQTGPSAYYETVAVQTDSSASCETVAAQTDPPASCKIVAVQTDPPASCESVDVQTDAVVCDTVACQTTDSLCGATIAVSATSVSSDEQSTAEQEEMGATAAAAVSVGVQTDGPACATVQAPKKNSNKDIVNELTAKFGSGDRKPVVISSHVNLNAMLKKIEIKGFKSLSFREMTFIHQKLIENSVAQCKKYKSLIQIAVKHLPTWQRGSIAEKHDLILIFATLDEMFDLNNKEIDKHKIDLRSEIKNRMDIEKECIKKDKLLSEMKAKLVDRLPKKSSKCEESAMDCSIEFCSNSNLDYAKEVTRSLLETGTFD